jgi:hypothetical protein
MDDHRWVSLLRGIDCPLDAPRTISNDYWDFVGALTVSSFYLAKKPDLSRTMPPHIRPACCSRYWGDARRGAPIWVTLMSEMADTRLPEPERRTLISKLQTALAVGQAIEQNEAAG